MSSKLLLSVINFVAMGSGLVCCRYHRRIGMPEVVYRR